MSLLKLLLKMWLGKTVSQSLSSNTGVSTDLLAKLLPLALPLLLKAMTSNASSNEGALSLLNAVGQHKTDRSMADLIKDADAEDGRKIIGHILGDKEEKEVAGLAKQTGLSSAQVSSVLANIAPSLLSGMSGVLANGLPEEKQSFFAKLFGKKEQKDYASDGTDLLKALMAIK